MKEGKHYVYAHYYPDEYSDIQKAGTAFYIGKGKGRRIDVHEVQARKGVKSHKCNVIRKIWANGGQVVKKILAYFETEQEAFQYEIALIFFMDGLTNLTNGGEGVSGVVMSETTRQKLREANTGKPSPLKGKPGKSPSEATRRKIGESGKGRMPWNKGKSPTEEELKHLRSISEARKGVKLDPELVQRRAASNRGRKRPPETGRKISEIKKDHPVSEATRRKISEKTKRRTPSSEELAKRVASNTGKKRSEEACRNLRVPHPAMKGRIPWNKGKSTKKVTTCSNEPGETLEA